MPPLQRSMGLLPAHAHIQYVQVFFEIITSNQEFYLFYLLGEKRRSDDIWPNIGKGEEKTGRTDEITKNKDLRNCIQLQMKDNIGRHGSR